MANVKISQLPATAAPQGAGLIPIVQDGTTYSTTAADLVALAAGGVTSFNTRDGAVTLQSGDVTGALGYTPVNPTTLADYVPETRTITINGSTQDLAANQTWTLASGAVTYPFTGSSINAGESVVINADGTISSAISSDPVPTANATRKGSQDNSIYNNMMSYDGARSVTSPHDPSLKVYTYIDQGPGGYLYLACTQNNDTEINFPLNTPINIGIGVTFCAVQFDPINPNLILVLSCNSNNMFGQYVSINYTYNNTSAPTLSLLGGQFYIGGNWNYFDFQFSVTYPNTIIAQYSDSNAGQLPYAVSMFITQPSPNYFVPTLGTAYSLSALGYNGPSNYIQKLNRLEGTDTFIASLNPFDMALNAYLNQVILFKIDPTYNDYNTAPALILGAPYVMVDYTNPSYQFASVLGATFLSATKIAYTFKEGMANNYYTVIGNVSDLTVSSIGAPNQFGSAYSLSNTSTAVYALPINGEQYVIFIGVATNGGLLGANIFCGIGKVTGNTIAFTDAGALAYNFGGVDNVGIGLFQAAGMITLSPSSVLSGVVNVCLNWWNSTNNAYMYFKTSTVDYINKVFSNKDLLGIAQNSVTTPATVEVLPFGSIDDNQGALVAGTSYYLQDNGVLTTNVTPTILGTALSSALIKTANYPTI